MSTTSIRSLGLLAFALMLGGVSCGGSGSNNDQGTSFLALGYFADETGSAGQTGQIVPLFTDTAADTPLQVADGNLAITAIGLQNRLTSQFIRVVRIDCTYDVPGTTLQVPDDSFNIGLVLGPATEAADSEVLGSVNFAEFEILSPDVMAYLNNNQNSLPQLPFRMSAICTATGVSQAGDTMTTNELPFQFQFVDFAECCTAGEGGDPGFPVGAGTGGDVTTFGGSEDGGDAGGVTLGISETDPDSETASDTDEATTN